jgi:hypothetical protein
VAETRVKNFRAAGVHIGKAMRQVYQCWRRICREINSFSMLEWHMICVLYPFVSYLLTLPHNRRSAARELLCLLWNPQLP